MSKNVLYSVCYSVVSPRSVFLRITFSSAISACGRGLQWLQSLMLLQHMQQAGHHHDRLGNPN